MAVEHRTFFLNSFNRCLLEDRHVVFADEASICSSDVNKFRWTIQGDIRELNVCWKRKSFKLICSVDFSGIPYYELSDNIVDFLTTD